MEWSSIAWHQILEKSMDLLHLSLLKAKHFLSTELCFQFSDLIFQVVLLHTYSCLNDVELDPSAFHKQKASLCLLATKKEDHFPLHQKKCGSSEWNSSAEKQSQFILWLLFSSHKCACKDSFLYSICDISSVLTMEISNLVFGVLECAVCYSWIQDD